MMFLLCPKRVVTEQIICEIPSSVHFSLNRKAAFFYFSGRELSFCFFCKSIQSGLHMRLGEQVIPFQFFLISVVIADFWKCDSAKISHMSISYNGVCFCPCCRLI